MSGSRTIVCGGQAATSAGQRQLPNDVMLYTPVWPLASAASGIVTYTHHMAEAMGRLGVRVRVLAGRNHDSAAAAAAAVSGAAAAGLDQVLGAASSRHRILDALGWRVSGEEHVRRRLRRRIAQAARAWSIEHPVDVIEIEESFGLAKELVRDGGPPVVVRTHGPWFLTGRFCEGFGEAASQRRVAEEGAVLAAAAGVTSPSEAALSAVRAHYGLELPHAAVIANPAPPPPDASRRWRPDAVKRDRIVFVGRLDELKGADVMLRAFGRLARERASASLVMVGGDGALSDQLREIAGAARVEVMRSQPPDALDALRLEAAVTVVPSRYEVFGMTAVEAMRLGCPVVAANVGGLAEIVQHGRNGLLFEAGNADDLAAHIGLMLDQPRRAAEMGDAAAVDCARRYDPLEIARRTLEFYAQVLDRRGHGGEPRS